MAGRGAPSSARPPWLSLSYGASSRSAAIATAWPHPIRHQRHHRPLPSRWPPPRHRCRCPRQAPRHALQPRPAPRAPRTVPRHWSAAALTRTRRLLAGHNLTVVAQTAASGRPRSSPARSATGWPRSSLLCHLLACVVTQVRGLDLFGRVVRPKQRLGTSMTHFVSSWTTMTQ